MIVTICMVKNMQIITYLTATIIYQLKHRQDILSHGVEVIFFFIIFCPST